MGMPPSGSPALGASPAGAAGCAVVGAPSLGGEPGLSTGAPAPGAAGVPPNGGGLEELPPSDSAPQAVAKKASAMTAGAMRDMATIVSGKRSWRQARVVARLI
jgi:hypothetical protein